MNLLVRYRRWRLARVQRKLQMAQQRLAEACDAVAEAERRYAEAVL